MQRRPNPNPNPKHRIIAKANSYNSPASSTQGRSAFNYHWDDHDAFVLQTEGVKTWTVCEKNFPLPPSVMMDYQEFNLDCQNLTMTAGDVLYLPLGTVHKAFHKRKP